MTLGLLLAVLLQVPDPAVGLVRLSEVDASRAGRSFDVLVWYPAQGGGTPARLEDYGARAAPGSAWTPAARIGASPAGGPRRLVLYVPMPLEHAGHNWRLMERLAGSGFLVAAYSPYGIRRGFMDVTAIDLQTQVRDVEFLVSRLDSRYEVAPGGPVIAGHSWGGLVAVATQLQSSPGAVVSLDGSEEYWRDVLESLPEFDLARLRAPYLRVRRTGSADFGFFSSAVFAPRYLVEVEGLSHSELASNPLLRTKDPDRLREYDELVGLVERFVQTVSAGATAVPQPGSPAVIFRPAATPPPTEEELLALFLSEGLQGALERIDAIEADGLAPAAEKALTRFSEQVMWTLRYPQQSAALLTRLLTLYPQSSTLLEHLGNHHWMAGEDAEAAAAFERALALDGDNPRLHENLRELRR